MTMQTIRWKQRFENFERIFQKLKIVLDQRAENDFSELEQEGLIQRFKLTFELAWKTLKNYLEFNGVLLEANTPRYIIKQAFSHGLIKDGEIWIRMLEHRNVMIHLYSEEMCKKVIKTIKVEYIVPIGQVCEKLKQEL